jgi:hypothetical protein
MKYVTYLVTYSGYELPKFYIGSTSEEKVKSGKYFGSIRSIKYKKIFFSEINNNIELFDIQILSYHDTRLDALSEELKLHIEYDVVKSKDYINESFATVNGFFGRDVSGENHPMWGKKHSEETKKKLRFARKNRVIKEETKRKISESNKGKIMSEEQKEKLRMINKGKVLSEETKNKISIAKLGKEPHNKGKIKDIILQIDCDGIIIKEWNNLNELMESGFEKSNVINVCVGKRKSHKGFIWRYKSDYNKSFN